MENGLSCMLNLLLEGQSPCGFRFGSGISINHLQSVDDTLIFCGDDVCQLKRIYAAIEAFMWVSGLKVNFTKSQLIGCNIPHNRVVELAQRFDFSSGQLPIQYLGAPLVDNPRLKQFWIPIIEKMRVKLAAWNSKFLLINGRLVLLKSVISIIMCKTGTW
ncbi:uncharacterized protein LOC130709453 [Lotus japonicus]|uniref:uncharacterized protein LOC130709453 n=1 Tax=Lotus japonicus TaxID=34305 RepID=UPI0025896F1D|nr:uncharacterized protein LOC130709453 [Lotus japonicus]